MGPRQVTLKKDTGEVEEATELGLVVLGVCMAAAVAEWRQCIYTKDTPEGMALEER